MGPGVVHSSGSAGSGENTTSTPTTSPATRSGRPLLHGERDGLASNARLSAHGRAEIRTIVNDRTTDTTSRSGRLGRVGRDVLAGVELCEALRQGSGVGVGDGGGDRVGHCRIYLYKGCEVESLHVKYDVVQVFREERKKSTRQHSRRLLWRQRDRAL